MKVNAHSNPVMRFNLKRPKVQGETVTLTFGDCAENHVGMQQIGERSEVGFNIEELKNAQQKFEAKGCATELVDLVEQLPASKRQDAERAWVLIVRGGIGAIVDPDDLKREQKKLTPDTKFYHARQKKVMNKHARYNLCFAPEG